MRRHRMIHALLAAALTASLVVPIPAGAAGVSSFRDVTDPATAINADILRLMGVVSGTGDNTFRPGDKLTRAQFCTMTVNFMGLRDQVVLHSTRTIFTDVPSSYWARGYINLAASTMVDAGSSSGASGEGETPAAGTPLIAGVGDGRFLPEQELTYAQAVTILIRVLGYSGDKVGAVWPDGYLNLAQSIGLADGVNAKANDALTRAQAAQLFVNALSCKTGDGKDYYTTLGAEAKADTVLLAVNTETDDGSAMGAVRTSSGTYLPDAEDVSPTALVGRRGVLVLNDQSEIVTFVPDDSTSVTISLMDSAEPSYLTAVGGERYTIAGDTLIYTASSSEGKPYSEGYGTLTAGTRVTLFTLRGKVTALYAGTTTTAADADAVIVQGPVNAASFYKLTGGAQGYTVLKNQQPVSLSQLQPYDVVTYDSMSNTLLVSDLRLTCKYQNPTPSPKAPTSITLLGHTFPVLESAWDFTDQVSAGQTVSLLLTVDGQVAGILPANAQTRSTALGMVTSETTVDLFLPNGGTLELKGADSKLKNVNQVCTIASTGENSISASRFSGDRATGDFDPAAMTMGELKVAPGVRVYEQFKEGAQVAIPLSSLDFGAIPQNQIRGVHKNSSDVVDVIVLNNVTGDAYTYGMMKAKVEVTKVPITDPDTEETIGYEEEYKTSWTMENRNRTAITFNKLAGYNGQTGDIIGAVADKNGLIISIDRLSEFQVSPGDFFEQDGRYYVTAKGRTYVVADQVECYKKAVGSWFDQEDGMDRLRACIAFSSNLTIYVDSTGNKVRIVTAN